MFGPILAGERLRLEPTQKEYLPEFIRWFADMDVTRYLLSRFPMTLKQEEEWFETTSRDQNNVHWTMVVDGRPIGVTGLNRINWVSRGAMSGTIIGAKEEWGKGYATEAVHLRTEFGFRELNFERIESQSMAPNVGMHKALYKAGYRKIGTASRYMYRDGEWLDSFLFECLRDDWEAAKTAQT